MQMRDKSCTKRGESWGIRLDNILTSCKDGDRIPKGYEESIRDIFGEMINEIDKLDINLNTASRRIRKEGDRYKFFITDQFTIIRSSPTTEQIQLLNMLRDGWKIHSSTEVGNAIQYVMIKSATDEHKELVELRKKVDELEEGRDVNVIKDLEERIKTLVSKNDSLTEEVNMYKQICTGITSALQGGKLI